MFNSSSNAPNHLQGAEDLIVHLVFSDQHTISLTSRALKFDLVVAGNISRPFPNLPSLMLSTMA